MIGREGVAAVRFGKDIIKRYSGHESCELEEAWLVYISSKTNIRNFSEKDHLPEEGIIWREKQETGGKAGQPRPEALPKNQEKEQLRNGTLYKEIVRDIQKDLQREWHLARLRAGK